MDASEKRRWDARLSLLVPILTILGILVGIWQYNDGQLKASASDLAKDKLEFERKLWMEKLEACRKISELGGVIASENSTPEERNVAVKRFRASHWGTMVVVEDKIIEKAMIELDTELRDLEGGMSDQGRIRQRVVDLGAACRASLRDDGNAPRIGPSDRKLNAL